MTALEFLSEKYGNQGYKGFFYLNHVLEMSKKSYPLSNDNFMINLMFDKIAAYYNTNSAAVERNIRTFKNKVGYKDVLKNFIFENIVEFSIKNNQK